MCKYSLFLLIILSLFGCNKEKFTPFKKYIIKEGKHSSSNKIRTLKSDTISFDVKFTETAIYKSEKPSNQYDINKLFGFSDCNQHHHENSARFGWRWLDEKIEIFSYVYNNGVRSYTFIKSILPNEIHEYQIIILEDNYIFSVDNSIVIEKRTNKCDVGLYYLLYPYFGGDESAPHKIIIFMKENIT